MTSRVLLLGLMLLASSDAFPALFEVTASGPVTYVMDPVGLLPFDAPTLGSQLILTFSFDDQSANESSFPYRGNYSSGVSPLQLQLSSQTWSLPGGSSWINVIDDCPCFVSNASPQHYDDSWQAAQNVQRLGGELEDFVLFYLFSQSQDLPVAPLASTVLGPPPSLGGWQTAKIIYKVQELVPSRSDRYAEIMADVTFLAVTPVPAPTPFVLLGTALAALGIRARLRC
jgi:hypothetical protein